VHGSDKRWCWTGGAAVRAAGWNNASAVLGVVTALAAEPQMAGGASMHRVATALGPPARSLLRWLEQSAPPVLRPVTVRPEAPSAAAGPVLVTPQGVRVEGLDRDTLIAVLRLLG
jgi:hypothetical protein